MNVILSSNQVNNSNIYYDEPIQNIIMDNSKFIKITYSTEDIMLSGIYLSLPIKYSKCEDFYKKTRVIYDTQVNSQLLRNIYEIETMILNKYNNHSKIHKRIIQETLNTGVIKYFSLYNKPPSNKAFILKISGIWENDTEYGLTYKIM
jgi:hypothetical protein